MMHYMCYRPKWVDIVDFTDFMSKCLHNVRGEYSEVHVIGDFNHPNVERLRSSPMTDHPFYTIVDEFGQMQLNKVASNKSANLLDLIFTNAPESITNIIQTQACLKRILRYCGSICCIGIILEAN